MMRKCHVRFFGGEDTVTYASLPDNIRFLDTEESYTSKASNLDLDNIPVFGVKPEGWKPSGRRVKRGLYLSATGIELNADINGAIGIARKVAEQYGFHFDARGFALRRFDNA